MTSFGKPKQRPEKVSGRDDRHERCAHEERLKAVVKFVDPESLERRERNVDL
jgi:hypothetical protein